MSLPTISDVQAVDPILTNMLVSYTQSDDRFIAGRLFPSVQVDKDSGTYYIVDKKYFFFNDLENRAPGDDFANLDFGLSTATYTTLQWAAQGKIPDEVRANNQVPMSLEQVSLRRIASASMIRKEVSFGTDFFATSVWATDATPTDWDDYTSSDPVADVLTATRTISNSTGFTANTMALGLIVHNALVNHPDILDRIKYTTTALMGTVEAALAAVFGVQNYWVGRASYSNTNESAAFSATAIIDDDCLITHVDPAAGLMGATAGKTFSWAGGGGDGTIYRDPARLNHSDVFQHKEQWDQKAVATDLGYFFNDIV